MVEIVKYLQDETELFGKYFGTQVAVHVPGSPPPGGSVLAGGGGGDNDDDDGDDPATDATESRSNASLKSSMHKTINESGVEVTQTDLQYFIAKVAAGSLKHGCENLAGEGHATILILRHTTYYLSHHITSRHVTSHQYITLYHPYP